MRCPSRGEDLVNVLRCVVGHAAIVVIAGGDLVTATILFLVAEEGSLVRYRLAGKRTNFINRDTRCLNTGAGRATRYARGRAGTEASESVDELVMEDGPRGEDDPATGVDEDGPGVGVATEMKSGEGTAVIVKVADGIVSAGQVFDGRSPGPGPHPPRSRQRREGD